MNQPFTAVPALYSVLFYFTLLVTSGYNNSLIRDPARGTSQLYLRVARTSAFKQIFFNFLLRAKCLVGGRDRRVICQSHHIQSNPAISNSVNSKSPLFRRKIEFPCIYPYVFSHLLSAISNSVISNSPLFRTHRSFPTP